MFILKIILTWEGEYHASHWLPRGTMSIPNTSVNAINFNSGLVPKAVYNIAEFNEQDVAIAKKIGKTEIIRELLCLNY